MKRLLSILLVWVMLLTMCTCAVAEEDATITVWYSQWTSEQDKDKPESEWLVNQMAREFEQLHPGVTVNMVYQNDQQVAMSKLRAAVLAGEAPDIANIYGFYFVSAFKDILLDITDMIPAEDLENIAGWDTGLVDGRNYAYPIHINEAGFLMYNKEIVAAAGVDLEGEGAPKNAAELWDAMQKIKDTGKGVFVVGDNGFNKLLTFIFSAYWSQISGLDRITSNSLAQTKFADDEGFKTALQYVADMYKAGFINEDYEVCADEDVRFMNGEGAFYVTTSLGREIYETMGDNLGVYMIPDYDENVANPGYLIGGAGQAAGVLNTCEHPELAVELLSFLSNRENSITLYKGNNLSLRKDISAEELGFGGSDIYARFFDLINQHTFTWNDNAMQGDVANAYYKYSTMATVGQISVEECCEELDYAAEDVALNAE